MLKNFPKKTQRAMIFTLIGFILFLVLAFIKPSATGFFYALPVLFGVLSVFISHLQSVLQQNEEDPQINPTIPKLSSIEVRSVRKLMILCLILILFPLGFLSYYQFIHNDMGFLKIVWPVLFVINVVITIYEIWKYKTKEINR